MICVTLHTTGLTQMLDYYAGNSYDESDGSAARADGSSMRDGVMQVRSSSSSNRTACALWG